VLVTPDDQRAPRERWRSSGRRACGWGLAVEGWGFVEVGQELADAACDRFVAFDFACPSLGAGLVGEFEFGGVAVTQPQGVLGCGPPTQMVRR
jgi:hypothetical protein